MPDRLLRIAATASQRTGWSLLLGLCSAPFLVIMIGLLVITVILIPLAFVLPILYFGALWTGQIATSYVLGSRILRRRLGQGSPLAPIAAGTLFVAMFFFVGALMSGPAGSFRTIALFLNMPAERWGYREAPHRVVELNEKDSVEEMIRKVNEALAPVPSFLGSLSSRSTPAAFTR